MALTCADTNLTKDDCLDLKQIKQIIDLMKRSELCEFEFEEEGFKIKIKRGSGGQPIITSAPHSVHPFPAISAPAEAPAPAVRATPQPAPGTAAGAEEVGFAYVKSPMVGTFYRSPSPENPAFVDVNAKVEEKTVVCIIEAMKIMNEIQAETKGTVVEILVENGQPVEYGQRLFKVKLG
ncbi:MAG: acetyl-CoA carboxylase biotin carboxyl carrier protein [Opitutae bacterium]|nr:acetyl-CoA carboxylase biotin carboxyl carrier protein [Opitutae bacterium]